MKHLFFTLLGTLLLTMAISCGRKVLVANFENDTNGRPPNTELPGDPEGDQIYFSGYPVYDPVVVSQRPGQEDKCITLTRRPRTTQDCFFITPDLDNTKSYTFTMTGYSLNDTQDGDIHIVLGTLHYRSALGFRLSAGRIFFSTDGETYTEVGTYVRNRTLTFVFTVHRGTREYNYVVANGASNINGSGTFDERVVTEGRKMGLNIFYRSLSSSDGNDPSPADAFVVCDVFGAETREE